MLIRVYGVLTSVFFCMWSALSTRNQRDISTRIPEVGSSSNQSEENTLTLMDIIRPLYLYHAADYYYNSVLVNQLKPVEDNDNKLQMDCDVSANLTQFPGKEEIKNQNIYISSAIRADHINNYRAEIIMLNFYLTIQAYETAIYFRICAFFYSYVHRDPVRYLNCSILSSYMEWYFSFLLEEKGKDLCEIYKYVNGEPLSKNVNATYVCKIFSQLSLNFLKLPQDLTDTCPIIKHDFNLYKPKVLMRCNRRSNYKKFVSILQQYKVPSKDEKQSQDHYNNMVFNQIWDLIMETYTNKFSLLMCYMYQVTTELYYSLNNSYWKPTYDNMKNYIWNYTEMFIEITKLPSNEKRGAYNGKNRNGNNIFVGDEIFRSNAVEILRQISYIHISSTLESAGINQEELKAEVNSGEPKCYIRIAPEYLGVDYTISLRGD